MKPVRLTPILLFAGVLILIFIAAGPAAASILAQPGGQSAANLQAPGADAPAACTDLDDPRQVPSPKIIHFDDLPGATVIGNNYAAAFGVRFENSTVTRGLIYANEPGKAASPPNFAINSAVSPNTSSGVPFRINFDHPKTHVGFYIGNGETQQITALMTAFDAAGAVVCQRRFGPVPEPQSKFLGLYDSTGSIVSVTLDYGQTTLSEAIDNLYFAPGLPPARPPRPKWTPVPTATPLPGSPRPTPTPVVPMMPYKVYNPKIIVFPLNFQPDYAIHNIEITQGIQCLDTSKGLAGCPDNSLPVVNKKDTAARIYIKANNAWSVANNIPVRLHIFANGVEYIANATGKASSTLDRGNAGSADVYFVVNFNSTVNVSFYADVDPDNLYSETNEGNNRFPAVGTISLNFTTRSGLKIVGNRLYYHPSGYSGSKYAGGWAVNGGAAQWLNQLLPIRNNGISYYVKGGYKNWTLGLGSGDNQHALIQSLNSEWILENVLSWWFSGLLTGADHYYGWAPNDGYSGGHADMPVYPHAGGFGVVGIGTDRPGTSTDDPNGGALIFGHELVHDYNVLHTNTVDACGSNDNNSNFPYASSSIQEYGFNTSTGKIYDPALTHDLMSYCPAGGSKQGWISPFTWNQMYAQFLASNQPTLPEAAPEGAEMQPWKIYQTNQAETLSVDLTIFNPASQPPTAGQLNTLSRVPVGLAVNPPKGPYAVELQDDLGTVLSSTTFAVNFESEYDAHGGKAPAGPDTPPPFPPDPTTQVDLSFLIPWVNGTTKVVLLSQGQVIDTRPVSLNPPAVTITNPTTSITWTTGTTETLSWVGSDLDGDPLVYDVMFSYDGGVNWALIAGGLTNPSLDLPVDSLPGGNDARFRVVASDGVNTGLDETIANITIPNKAPIPTILSPLGGLHYEPGAIIVLEGGALDLEDGSLPDEALEWIDSVDGSLGIGPLVAINTLAPGKHTITLVARDSYGITAATTVTIIIGYPTQLPVLTRNR